MSDRNLLELAAKAAGYVVDWDTYLDCGSHVLYRMHYTQEYWNPLTDDGDALRLAVTLGEKYPALVVGIFNRAALAHTSASVVHRDGAETYVEQDAGDDLAAATRRAIVRVAAAIGAAQ